MIHREFAVPSRSVSTVFVFIATLMFTVALANAQTETPIHAFGRGTPFGGVIADSHGALYGATSEGGKYNFGAVYSLSPPLTQDGLWTVHGLYSFTGGADGASPFGNLVFDKKSGKIYGTTQLGGLNNQGVVYELTRPSHAGEPWTEAVLYTFTGGPDGGQPLSGVIVSKGNLYGTTPVFGTGKCGVVFRLSPPTQGGVPWTEDVLYSFQGGDDSCGPYTSLILRH